MKWALYYVLYWVKYSHEEFQNIDYTCNNLNIMENFDICKNNLLAILTNLMCSILLLLNCFSRVQLCVIPETAAHQAPPSLGFSRQEHWSGLQFPSPMHESEKWKWSHSVVSDSWRPLDCSLPGSSIHGIFQARVLESGAIAFSDMLYNPDNIANIHALHFNSGPLAPTLNLQVSYSK